MCGVFLDISMLLSDWYELIPELLQMLTPQERAALQCTLDRQNKPLGEKTLAKYGFRSLAEFASTFAAAQHHAKFYLSSKYDICNIHDLSFDEPRATLEGKLQRQSNKKERV